MRQRRHPELWRNCIGAWCPKADNGRSTILTDHTPQSRPLTLTNMDPATDWISACGQECLALDRSNDHIRGPWTYCALPLSLSCWFVADTVAVGVQRLLTIHTSGQGATPGFYSLYLNSAAIAAQTQNPTATESASGGTLTTGRLYHATAVFHSTTLREIYLDGALLASNSNTVAAITAVDYAILGGIQWSSGLIQLFGGKIIEAQVYAAALSVTEIKTLSLRPGIMHETVRNRRSHRVAGPTFKAAWLTSRQSQIIGGGMR